MIQPSARSLEDEQPFWLSAVQMARLQPFSPKSHGKPCVDDRRLLSGIIFFNRNGLRGCDAPREYGGRSSRKKTVKYDKRRYKRRNRIEIMFGRLKDWRRVATRYDRCPETFFSAIALAATVLFWL